MLAVAPVLNGFAHPGADLAVVTEAELYPSIARTRGGREGGAQDHHRRHAARPVRGQARRPGGARAARHRPLPGLVNLDLGDGATEFLLLEYEGGDKLYVPVSQLFLISRYSGGPPEAAPLHKLGSGQWDKAKRKAAAQVRDTAAELLNLYAQRAARAGSRVRALSSTTTKRSPTAFRSRKRPIRPAAIEAVLDDLQQGKPMDRLVCGDVGFGKTEVALRAAFVAVTDGKQVAVLVPTTLLAEQHFNNFSDRFADWPVQARGAVALPLRQGNSATR